MSEKSSPHHPSALRNRVFIWTELQRLLDKHVKKGSIQALEVASGSGAHVEYFAPLDDRILWQQTDRGGILPEAVYGVDGELVRNVRVPKALDLMAFEQEKSGEYSSQGDGQLQAVLSGFRCSSEVDLLYVSNLCHISPIMATRNLFTRVLPGVRPKLFVVYGPFKLHGEFTTKSNEEFDKDLRARDSSWGLRNTEELEVMAGVGEVKWILREQVEMPANNFLLVFVRKD